MTISGLRREKFTTMRLSHTSQKFLDVNKSWFKYYSNAFDIWGSNENLFCHWLVSGVCPNFSSVLLFPFVCCQVTSLTLVFPLVLRREPPLYWLTIKS